MFCEKCGKPVEDTDKFCMHCGWRVSEENVEKKEASEKQAAAEQPEAGQKQAAAEQPEAGQKQTAAEQPEAGQKQAATEQPEAGQKQTAAEQPEAGQKQAAAEQPEAGQKQAASEQPEAGQKQAASEQPEAGQKQAAVERQEPAQQPARQKIEAEPQPVMGTGSEYSAPKKRKKGPLIAIACVVVLVLIVGLNASAMKNFVKATFSSPEEYYRDIEKQQAEEFADSFTAYYDILVDSLDITNKGGEAEIGIELGEDIRDLIGFAGVDVSELEKLSLTVGTDIKDQKCGVDMAVSVNKDKLLSANMAMDFEEEAAYLQIPELNKTYLGMEFSDAGIEYDDEMWTMLETIVEKLPESKKFNKLLNKYIGIALDCVDDVDKDKDELKVGDIEKEYTTLEVTIDGKTMQKMAEAVLEEMQDDKDLKNIILEVGELTEEYARVDADDLYDELMGVVDSLLDELDSIGNINSEIVMTLWIDGKGNVVGRTVELDGMKISYLMPQKGSKFAFEFSGKYGVQSVSLEGAGKKSGNKLSGDFEVKYNSVTLIELQVKNYDIKKLKEGYLCGDFTVSLSSMVGTILNTVSGMNGAALMSAFSDYSINMNLQSDNNSYKTIISLLDDEDVMLKLNVSGKSSKGGKVSIPSSKNTIMVEDDDDLEEWAEDIDLEEFLEKLEDAGFPSELLSLPYLMQAPVMPDVLGSGSDSADLDNYGYEFFE